MKEEVCQASEFPLLRVNMRPWLSGTVQFNCWLTSMFDVCISSGSLCVFPSMVRLHELFNWKCAFSDTAGTEALSQPQLTPFWKSFRLRGQAVNCLVFSSSLLNNEGNPIIPSISNCDTKHQLKGKLSPAIGPVVLVCGHIPDWSLKIRWVGSKTRLLKPLFGPEPTIDYLGNYLAGFVFSSKCVGGFVWSSTELS